MAASVDCSLCGVPFASKNRLFRHLRDSANPCGRAAAAQGGVGVGAARKEKAMLVFAYGGVSAAAAMERVCAAAAAAAGCAVPTQGRTQATAVAARHCPALAQGEGCAALADVATLRLPHTADPRAFVSGMNAALRASGGGTVRVLRRQKVGLQFNAEADATRRRYEYVLPLSLLMPRARGGEGGEADELLERSLAESCVAGGGGGGAGVACGAAAELFAQDAEWRSIADVDPVAGALRGLKALVRLWRDGLEDCKAARWHNYCDLPVAPSELCARRRLDRVFVRSGPVLPCNAAPDDGGACRCCWDGKRRFAVISVAGDAFLQGQVRTLTRPLTSAPLKTPHTTRVHVVASHEPLSPSTHINWPCRRLTSILFSSGSAHGWAPRGTFARAGASLGGGREPGPHHALRRARGAGARPRVSGGVIPRRLREGGRRAFKHQPPLREGGARLRGGPRGGAPRAARRGAATGGA